jgi:hypothetical protein
MRGDRRLVRLGTWVWWLLCGEGRLPPDVSGQTMGSVLRAVGDTADGTLGIYRVCDRCGLPRHRPRGVGPDPFAAGCPHCGEAAWTLSNRLGEGRPWQELAAAELEPDSPPGRQCRRRVRA